MIRQEFNQIASRLQELGMSKEARKWKELEYLLDVDLSSFRVVVVGQQNGGKSTLLNALCGRPDLDWFETGDRIVTRDAQEKEYGGVIFVDTPGLDTTDLRDDRISSLMSKSACVILFVHSCAIGELDHAEYDRFREFVSRLDDPSRQIIVLCSKDGEIFDKEKLEDIVAKIRKQVDAAGGGKTKVLSIDSKDYLEGIKENEPRLIDGSHVPELLQWLSEQRALSSNQAEKEFSIVRDDIAGVLKNRRKALDELCGLSAEKEQRARLLQNLMGKWQELWHSIELIQTKCVQSARKLKELKQNLASHTGGGN